MFSQNLPIFAILTRMQYEQSKFSADCLCRCIFVSPKGLLDKNVVSGKQIGLVKISCAAEGSV
jgi:hypothetical protein